MNWSNMNTETVEFEKVVALRAIAEQLEIINISLHNLGGRIRTTEIREDE